MNKYFLAGFIAGEGCFGFYKLKGRKTSCMIIFTVEVNERDENILKEIQTALECGKIYESYRQKNKLVKFQVSNRPECLNRVIPFMNKYLIGSYKRTQYEQWRNKVINYDKQNENK